jgi:cob(I)alamin adenosyltransferase
MPPSTQTPQNQAQRGTGRGIGIRTAAGANERSHGQLHVYDGEGKGKSQAALGVVLRTIGLGICEQKQTRVLLLRFLKGPGRCSRAFPT